MMKGLSSDLQRRQNLDPGWSMNVSLGNVDDHDIGPKMTGM